MDAMRKVLNSISMDGVVIIGEGEKDEVSHRIDGAPQCQIPYIASLAKCGVHRGFSSMRP